MWVPYVNADADLLVHLLKDNLNHLSAAVTFMNAINDSTPQIEVFYEFRGARWLSRSRFCGRLRAAQLVLCPSMSPFERQNGMLNACCWPPSEERLFLVVGSLTQRSRHSNAAREMAKSTQGGRTVFSEADALSIHIARHIRAR
jgi:hypothetical protein